jgi:hypothetical protein
VPRLATCMICAKIERIPDVPDDVPMVPARVTYMDMGVEREYTFKNDDGSVVMVPEYDPILEDVVGRHKHGRPDSDFDDYFKVMPVSQETYDKMDVVTELKRELTGLTDKIWEESTFYKDEALACYNKHGNPTLPGKGCIDFCDDSKQIGPTTKKKKHQIYLCHVCPYMQTYVAQEMRQKKGLYATGDARKKIWTP